MNKYPTLIIPNIQVLPSTLYSSGPLDGALSHYCDTYSLGKGVLSLRKKLPIPSKLVWEGFGGMPTTGIWWVAISLWI